MTDRDAFSQYKINIESADAEIVESGGYQQFEGQYPEAYAKFHKRFGVHNLTMIEFWGSGGVSGTGIENSDVIRAMKVVGWKGQTIKDSRGTLHIHKAGPRTGEIFVLHRDSENESGFNLCAPPIFLPSGNGAVLLSQHAVEAGNQYLFKLLTDMTELREEVCAAIGQIGK